MRYISEDCMAMAQEVSDLGTTGRLPRLAATINAVAENPFYPESLFGKLRSTALFVCDRIISKIAQAADPKKAALLEAFPNWHVLPLATIGPLVDKVKALATDQGLYSTTVDHTDLRANASIEKPTNAQVIGHSLDGKERHLVGAIGATGQADLTNYRARANGVALLELLLVDIPDTAGDYGGLREPQDSRALYSYAVSAFTGEPVIDTELSDPERQPLLGFMDSLRVLTAESIDQILGNVRDPEVVNLIRVHGAQISRDYGMCVEIMHIQDPVERIQAAKEYLSHSILKGREVLPWLNEPTLWYAAQGSPLGAFGLLTDASIYENIQAEELSAIVNYYDQTIGFAHVLFDDTEDRREDDRNGDPNLFSNLLAGAYDEQIRVLHEIHEPNSPLFMKNAASRSQKFFEYLGKEFQVKRQALEEAIGPKRAAVHLSIFRDLVKFYHLQIERDGAMLDSYEMRAFAALLHEIR